MTFQAPARRGPEGRFRLRHIIAGSAVVALLAGCDIPTDPPQVETRWIVPAQETSFGVAELLPGDVQLTADSSAFLVTLDPVVFSQSLGGICAACIAADGLTVPKPPFVGGFTGSVSMPAQVSYFEVIDGQVVLELFNGFNFDPIRPASGVYGTMTLDIMDSADNEVLGTTAIDGEDTAFAPGTTLVTSVDLLAASVEGAIGVRITMDSPTGDPVTIDSSDLVQVTATPTDVRVARVAIDVANQVVDFDPVSLDVEDVERDLVDRIVSGAFVLDIVNPFEVAADFDLTISGPTISTIQKSEVIGTATESTVVIEFTQAELRSFLGEPGVLLSGGAVVDAGAGTVIVEPGQSLLLTAALDVTLLLGG